MTQLKTYYGKDFDDILEKIEFDQEMGYYGQVLSVVPDPRIKSTAMSLWVLVIYENKKNENI